MNYLAAQTEIKQIEVYAMDLVWALVKKHYSSDLSMPSEIWNNKNKIDRRTGKQILDDLLKGLGGE